MSHNLFSKFVQQLKKSLSIGPQKIKIDIKAAITTVVDVKAQLFLSSFHSFIPLAKLILFFVNTKISIY